jgi:abhydrolase domain-containing protein 13
VREGGTHGHIRTQLQHGLAHRACSGRGKVILYGKSLGGAVALALAERSSPDHIHAIVLENTFLSIPAMVDVLMPLVRHVKGLILRIGWRSDLRIQRVTQPLLLISGLRDELVPPSHMAQLRRLAVKSRKVVLHTVADGTHK